MTLCGWQDGRGPQVNLAEEEEAHCQGTTVACVESMLAKGFGIGDVVADKLLGCVTFK